MTLQSLFDEYNDHRVEGAPVGLRCCLEASVLLIVHTEIYMLHGTSMNHGPL